MNAANDERGPGRKGPGELVDGFRGFRVFDEANMSQEPSPSMVVDLQKENAMPKQDPIPTPAETPREPQGIPGRPDRGLEKPAEPPIKKPEDSKDPTDPTLLPIGDPAGMA
ncbi:hypothetical protein ABIE78_002809 [Sinorhizobium fredii]|uniref:hypothetical protein n=1 Tax=Rhizobium fredii TaxID=380 RepID=UPI001CC23D07|nr:hypothetical protein [Sinorhizobium fredii]